MMYKPDISVIVPAFNAGAFIEKCINCILQSTQKNIEVIVIDDKSTDDTLKKIKSIADARLQVVALKIQGGVSKARNIGIEMATGKYLTFVDADDWIAPTMIETLYETAIQQNSDITICNHFEVYEKGEKIAGDIGMDLKFEGVKINQYIQMFMLKGHKEFKPYFPIGQPWGTLYRSELIKKNYIKFVEGMQYKEDVIFNLQAAQYANTIVRINEPLYFYNRSNSGSLTTSGLKKGMLPRIEKDIEERTKFSYQYRKDDKIFSKGLHQHTCRSFFRNIVPACIIDADYKQCKKILNQTEYMEAFRNIDYNYFGKVERVILFVIKNNGLLLYYFAVWIFMKIQKK